MLSRFRIAGAAALLAVMFGSNANAQVTFSFSYLDPVGGGGAGFNDDTVDAGETLSRGQLRRNTMTAVGSYLSNVLDGRGNVQMRWDVSDTTPGGFLASFGPEGFTNINGTFQNGQAYQVVKSGTRPFAAPDGSGLFDFTYSYNYVGANTNNGSKYDMFSVALHELTHGLGFINVTDQNGLGFNQNGAGNPDVYSGYDKFLQRGNGGGAQQQFQTNISNSGYASFIGTPSTFTNGNNTTTGLFFGGQYAREAFGNPVPLYAPAGYVPGSSIGHDNTTPEGVMNFNIAPGVSRQSYLAYEIAMLLDLGYNVYNWNANTTASWTGGNVNSLGLSPWRTDMGIVYDGAITLYNMNANPAQAPILAPYGQVTSNIVLNFNGTSAYTSTNDLGTIRMSRINLNSTAGTASTIMGGTLLFGQNSDGTFSVLTPKIVQKNTGSFIINSTVQIADPTRGLTVDGTGSGAVTFTGNLTGAGGFTKSGAFTVFMNGGANSYAGTTMVNQGVLQINGAKTGTGAIAVNNGGSLVVVGSAAGAVTVNNGGVLKGGGTLSGATSVATGGMLAPGASAGNLTMTGSLTMNAGTYDWELASLTTNGPGTNFDLITLNGGTSTLGGTSAVLLDFALLSAGLTPNGSNSFWTSAHQWQIVSLLSGSLSGNFSSITNPTWSSGSFSLSPGGGGIFLNFAPVPEPSTLILIGACGALWVLRNRLKQPSQGRSKV